MPLRGLSLWPLPFGTLERADHRPALSEIAMLVGVLDADHLIHLARAGCRMLHHDRGVPATIGGLDPDLFQVRVPDPDAGVLS